MHSSLRPAIEKLWHYHHLDHEVTPSDAILVLCSHDRIVAERGAQLWLDKGARFSLPAPGRRRSTRRFAGGGAGAPRSVCEMRDAGATREILERR